MFQKLLQFNFVFKIKKDTELKSNYSPSPGSETLEISSAFTKEVAC